MLKQPLTLPPWLHDYWGKVASYIEQDRLPSAFMLVGDKGLGLPNFSVAFANRVICLSPNAEDMACGFCEACVLFNAGNYPDFFHLQPEEGKSSIKIDAIRELSASLALSNQFSKPRIVIIDPADAMLSQASNSLLKTLEEPNEDTCLILIAHDASKISATIRSRCQVVTVKDIDLGVAKSWLEEQGCNDADLYLNLSNYSPILAQNLWEKNILEKRATLWNDFKLLVDGKLDPLLFSKSSVGLDDVPVLKWLMSWLTDAIKCKHNLEYEKLMNPDLLGDLKLLVEKLHLKDLHGLVDRLGAIISFESSQVNQQLMLEDFAIRCYSLTVK